MHICLNNFMFVEIQVFDLGLIALQILKSMLLFFRVESTVDVTDTILTGCVPPSTKIILIRILPLTFFLVLNHDTTLTGYALKLLSTRVGASTNNQKDSHQNSDVNVVFRVES